METSTGKTTADMLYEKSMANYVEALKARVEYITTGIKHYQEDIDTINKRIAIDQQQIDITNQRIKEAEEKLK